MNEPTDEELTAIYSEANSGYLCVDPPDRKIFAAMRLAMERARKEERDRINRLPDPLGEALNSGDGSYRP